MYNRQTTFFQNPQLTFVNYGTELDLGYRTEARKHNARFRAVTSHKGGQEDEPENKQSLVSDWSLTGATITLPNARPLDALSSFRRDQFRTYPIAMTSNDYCLESTWFSKFQDIFFLPQLPPHSQLTRPQELIFKDSIGSGPAFQGLILVAAATAGARGMQSSLEDLLARQTILLQHFRALVEQFYNLKRPWTSGFRELYAATFAFATEGFGKESALDEMQYSNFSVMARCFGKFKPIPMIEWVRTLLPVPGTTPGPDLEYEKYWNMNAVLFFKFLELAQTYAVNHGQSNPQLYSPFQKGTALYQIITTPTKGFLGRQPHPDFYEFCRLRVLTHLHLYLIQPRRLHPDVQGSFFPWLETLAAECVLYDGPTSVALFLWALMTSVDELHEEVALQEKILSVPSKDLLVKKGVCFADEMAAWLLQDRDQDGNLVIPLLDFGALSQTFRYSV